jgi:hypothetical protein
MLKDLKLLFQSIVYDDSKWLLKDWKLQPLKKNTHYDFCSLFWHSHDSDELLFMTQTFFIVFYFFCKILNKTNYWKTNNFSVVVTDDGPFAFQLSIDPSMQEYLNQSLGLKLKETLDMSIKNQQTECRCCLSWSCLMLSKWSIFTRPQITLNTYFKLVISCHIVIVQLM